MNSFAARADYDGVLMMTDPNVNVTVERAPGRIRLLIDGIVQPLRAIEFDKDDGVTIIKVETYDD